MGLVGPDKGAKLMAIHVRPRIALDPGDSGALLRAMAEGLIVRNASLATMARERFSLSLAYDLFVMNAAPNDRRVQSTWVGGQALLFFDDRPVGVVDCGLDAPITPGLPASTLKVTSVSLDESASAIFVAIDTALALDQAASADFDLRLLRVNELQESFVWLAGDTNLFLPVHGRAGFEIKTTYEAAAMAEHILDRLEERAASEALLRYIDTRTGAFGLGDYDVLDD